jgi:hypothetical protein
MKMKTVATLGSWVIILCCFDFCKFGDNVRTAVNSVDTLTGPCGISDLQTLATRDSISEACKKAIMSYLPQPQNSLTDRLLSLGAGIVDGELTLFCTGTGSLSSVFTGPAAVQGLFRYDNGVKSIVDTTQYACKKIKDFKGTVVSLSAILDYSGSMSDADIDDGVEIFSDLFSVTALTNRFETDIILFSDSVLVRMDFSNNADTISKYIARYNGFGRKSTQLLDALGTGLTGLSRRTSPVRLVVVATDGKENASKIYKSRQDIYTLSRSNRIPVIILGSLFADLDFMKEVSRETGGAFIYSRTILELKQKALEIGGMFENAAGIVLDSTLTKSPPDSFALEKNGQRIIFTPSK